MRDTEGTQWQVDEDLYVSLKYFPGTGFKWRWCATKEPFPVEEADWIWWLPNLVRIKTINTGSAMTKLGARAQIRMFLNDQERKPRPPKLTLYAAR